jgi:hypothetical protein
MGEPTQSSDIMFNTTCSSNALSNASSYTVCSEKPKCGSELSTPSYSSIPKTASSCGSKPPLTIVSLPPVSAGYGGVTTPAPVVLAAYGGGLTVPTPAPKAPCGESKSGLSVRSNDGDRNQSRPLGGRETENERENDKSPLKKLAGKCNDAKNFVVGLITPPTPIPTVGGAGYGGSVTTPVVTSPGPGSFMGSNAGSGFGSQCVHFNQGIGNGAEGGDPGKSRPHGGSNDETGRTPGQKCVK